MWAFWLGALLQFAGLVHGASVFTVEGNLRLPKSLKASAGRVVLNGGEYTGLVRHNGQFFIYDVPAGTYVLDVHITGLMWNPISLTIEPSVQGAEVKASSLGRNDRLPYPLQLRPVRELQYFQVRPPIQYTAYLKNPMVLMMIFTGVMALVMPKLMGSMDPEELKEMQKMQSQFSLQNVLKEVKNAK